MKAKRAFASSQLVFFECCYELANCFELVTIDSSVRSFKQDFTAAGMPTCIWIIGQLLETHVFPKSCCSSCSTIHQLRQSYS